MKSLNCFYEIIKLLTNNILLIGCVLFPWDQTCICFSLQFCLFVGRLARFAPLGCHYLGLNLFKKVTYWGKSKNDTQLDVPQTMGRSPPSLPCWQHPHPVRHVGEHSDSWSGVENSYFQLAKVRLGQPPVSKQKHHSFFMVFFVLLVNGGFIFENIRKCVHFSLQLAWVVWHFWKVRNEFWNSRYLDKSMTYRGSTWLLSHLKTN